MDYVNLWPLVVPILSFETIWFRCFHYTEVSEKHFVVCEKCRSCDLNSCCTSSRENSQRMDCVGLKKQILRSFMCFVPPTTNPKHRPAQRIVVVFHMRSSPTWKVSKYFTRVIMFHFQTAVCDFVWPSNKLAPEFCPSAHSA